MGQFLHMFADMVRIAIFGGGCGCYGLEDRRSASGLGQDPISHSQFSLQISPAVTAGNLTSRPPTAVSTENKGHIWGCSEAAITVDIIHWLNMINSFYFLALCSVIPVFPGNCVTIAAARLISSLLLVTFEASKLHFTFPHFWAAAAASRPVLGCARGHETEF